MRDPNFHEQIITVHEERIAEKDLEGSNWQLARTPEFDRHYFRHSRVIRNEAKRKEKTFGSYELWPKGAA